MSISDVEFELEIDLQNWVFQNIRTFLGDCILIPGFRIKTPSGKSGIPDGFAFNFETESWWIIECELLKHGVWPHIAEQLTRFVVAGRNSDTTRQVRDRLFETVLEMGDEKEVIRRLQTTNERLFQKLELFIESISPSIAVFIDDTSQDLLDFCAALDVPTEIYRIKKFNVNGSFEYYSPDKMVPAFVAQPEESNTKGAKVFDAIEKLGSDRIVSSKLQCYLLTDGRIVKAQYSKFHERHQAYWYGINPSSLTAARELECSHFIFVMGEDGFVDLPVSIVEEYLEHAYVTKNSDGSVRHFHIHISSPPDIVMKGYGNMEDISVSKNFVTWE